MVEPFPRIKKPVGRKGLKRKYSPSGFVPIGMDCMALTCLRQVSANGIPQGLRSKPEELQRKARFAALGRKCAKMTDTTGKM
jgi:hypothetical protein